MLLSVVVPVFVRVTGADMYASVVSRDADPSSARDADLLAKEEAAEDPSNLGDPGVRGRKRALDMLDNGFLLNRVVDWALVEVPNVSQPFCSCDGDGGVSLLVLMLL